MQHGRRFRFNGSIVRDHTNNPSVPEIKAPPQRGAEADGARETDADDCALKRGGV